MVQYRYQYHKPQRTPMHYGINSTVVYFNLTPFMFLVYITRRFCRISDQSDTCTRYLLDVEPDIQQYPDTGTRYPARNSAKYLACETFTGTATVNNLKG